MTSLPCPIFSKSWRRRWDAGSVLHFVSIAACFSFCQWTMREHKQRPSGLAKHKRKTNIHTSPCIHACEYGANHIEFITSNSENSAIFSHHFLLLSGALYHCRRQFVPSLLRWKANGRMLLKKKSFTNIWNLNSRLQTSSISMNNGNESQRRN